MKLGIALIFCFFIGAAFAQDPSLQDSSLVPLNPDTSAIDSIVAIPDTVDYDTSFTDSVKIKSGLHFFVSFGAQFINFKDRAIFQALLDTQYAKYMDDYLANSAGFGIPLKQDFQSVNLAFPITVGIMWQFNDMHSLGLGAGFLYDKESVILTDKYGENHNLKYVLQAFPVFAEYRLSVSPNFISLKNGDYFSLFLRYYWMLPHSEFYSIWGNAEADFDPLGSGYGVFLGYRFWEWGSLSIWGELGYLYLNLNVKPGDENELLNSWNLDGISISIRAMF
jgi:hypothetical protein